MKLKALFIILPIIIGGFIIGNDIYKKHYKLKKEYKKININHIIKYMYYEEYKGSKIPILNFDGINYEVRLYCVAFQELCLNDSISKNKGSLKIEVFRKGKRVLERNCE
jgi:hypothetical protein